MGFFSKKKSILSDLTSGHLKYQIIEIICLFK